MSLDVGSFVLGEVMIHDVPAGGSGLAPTLTTAPTPLDAELEAYFQRKIVASLEARGVEVVASPDEDSTVRVAVHEILSDPTALVAASGRVASRLAEVQTTINPAGLLVIAQGAIGEVPCIALLKLEREEGVRFEISHRDDTTTVDLQLLRDLTLTKKTRVFKTAVLASGDGQTPMSVYGVASDNQRGQQDGRGVAVFFLENVLGCQLAVNAALATQQWARATQDWINDASISDERRGQYQVALLAELQSQDLDLKPSQFARTAIESTDRHEYLSALRAREIEPGQVFPKDTTLTRRDGFKLTFASGMTLVGNRDDLEQRVHISDESTTISDPLKTIQGR